MPEARAASAVGASSVSRAPHRGRTRVLVGALCAAALVFGIVGAARAAAVVDISDGNLRAAVARQLVDQGQIPAGSTGTTMTPSDMEALLTLSAPDEDIEQLGGLEHAVNLTAVDLSANAISDLAPLGELVRLEKLDVSLNRLDLAKDSPARSVLGTLEGLGADVSAGHQAASLARLVVSASVSTYGKHATFSVLVSPASAASSSASVVRLSRLETKSVTRRVHGKKKKVKVNYWHLRRKIKMSGSVAAGVCVTTTVPYAGKWQAQVVSAGSDDYGPCTSTITPFVVHDPRIERAIKWAKGRLGSHSWDHYCLKFASDSYAKGADTTVSRFSNAKRAAAELHASSHRSTNAPRGAYVFYDSYHGRTNLGHVGISLGDGTMINAYGSHGVKIMPIECTLHYIGWAVPPTSPRIIDWNRPPAS